MMALSTVPDRTQQEIKLRPRGNMAYSSLELNGKIAGSWVVINFMVPGIQRRSRPN
jgi:hypothetical protein